MYRSNYLTLSICLVGFVFEAAFLTVAAEKIAEKPQKACPTSTEKVQKKAAENAKAKSVKNDEKKVTVRKPVFDTRTPDNAGVHWMANYAKACDVAEQQNKMLLIYFYDKTAESLCGRFEHETIQNPLIERKLQNYVCLKMPIDATIKLAGKDERIVLLEHPAFNEMLGRPGIAVLDYRTKARVSGDVVSEFPLTEKLWYNARQMSVILDLPPGSLTERTLIYAVRVHPDHPSSTEGELLPLLETEAQSQAQYQADIRLQGHHFWNTRFQRILSLLPGNLAPREVCAESWPGEHLVEAAIECVRCWRYSSGHWEAVNGHHPFYGYDMKRGDNGIWYATGIFGGGQ